MSGFKKMLAKDLCTAFVNVREFGELASIEGKPITIVLDDDLLKKRQGSQEMAIAESTVLFHAITAELPHRIYPGSSINFNGREYIVDDYSENMGLSTIALRETVGV